MERFGKSASSIRNAKMLKEGKPDFALVFHPVCRIFWYEFPGTPLMLYLVPKIPKGLILGTRYGIKGYGESGCKN